MSFSEFFYYDNVDPLIPCRELPITNSDSLFGYYSLILCAQCGAGCVMNKPLRNRIFE